MTKRILFIDDETTILIAFKKLLQCPEIEVDTAETINDATYLLDKRSYDAVIADLRLSGFSGQEGLAIIQYVKKRYPDSRVILITAYGNQDIQNQAYHFGASYYFEKPVSANIIRNALREMGIP
jgi:DNA-binding NtrC family response regulator